MRVNLYIIMNIIFKKNIIVVGLVFIMVAIMTPTAMAQQTTYNFLTTEGNSIKNAPINPNNSNKLDINAMELAPRWLWESASSLGTKNLFTNASISNVIFRLAGTAILDHAIAFGDASIRSLSVGDSSRQTIMPSDPSLMVDGTIQIEALADSSAPAEVQVCVNDFGVLARCDTSTIDTLQSQDIFYADAGVCSTAIGSHPTITGVSAIITDDPNNPNEVSWPTTDPNYNGTFVRNYHWQQLADTFVTGTHISSTAYCNNHNSVNYGCLLDEVPAGIPNFNYRYHTRSEIESAPFVDVEFRNNNQVNVLDGEYTHNINSISTRATENAATVYARGYGTGRLFQDETIYRVRALDTNGVQVGDWKYFNALRPVATGITSPQFDTSITNYNYLAATKVYDGKLPSPGLTLNEITFNWEPSVNDTSDMAFFRYILQRRSCSRASNSTCTTATNAPWNDLSVGDYDNIITTFTDDTVQSNSSYQYRLAVVNVCGSNSTSDNSVEYSNTVYFIPQLDEGGSASAGPGPGPGGPSGTGG